MKTICVYCGSNSGKLDDYIANAKSLGQALVKNDITLVYGGASVGLMGALADSVLSSGGKVIGIIPKALFDKEVGHNGLTELHVVASMHERKTLMAELSDGFIAMPGGMGTLEELFEVMTWGQLGFHNKPCALLNIAGYFDHLKTFLAHSVEQQFIGPEHTNMLLSDNDPQSLIDQMASMSRQSLVNGSTPTKPNRDHRVSESPIHVLNPVVAYSVVSLIL